MKPTTSPTKSPTNQPTPSPSNAPTDPPITANPTKTPTPEPTMPPPTSSPTNTPPPTPLPTHSINTPCAGISFKVNVLTDNYPGETTWALKNTCTGLTETNSPAFSTAATQYSNTYCLSSAEYDFTINDSYGDGNCCSYGEGSYDVHVDGVMVASGGQFGSSETTTFGSCI